MNDSQSSIPEYYPEVILRKLIIDREEVNLNRFYSADRKQILLSEEQNTFSLQFVALDYLNSDIEYAYILEGYDEKWSLFLKKMRLCLKCSPWEYLLRYTGIRKTYWILSIRSILLLLKLLLSGIIRYGHI